MPYRTVREILDTATRAEEYAARFYQRAAEVVNEERPRLLLKDLAREELKHRAMLESFKAGAAGKAIIPFEPAVSLEELPSDKALSPQAKLTDILAIALKREEATAKYYEGIARNAPSDKVAELFSSLKEYEYQHMELVRKEYEYYR